MMMIDTKNSAVDTVAENRTIINRMQPCTTNPEAVMHSAIGKVNRLYGHMQERTGFAATDFNTYLKVREPQLLAKMNAVWKLIDCDIYYRFLDGRLQEKEFRNWRKHLSEWVDVLRSAIELYCLHRIDVVESDKVFVQSSTSV